MHRRFILDWKSASLALICVSLVLLPVTGTFAGKKAESLVGQPEGGGLRPTTAIENPMVYAWGLIISVFSPSMFAAATEASAAVDMLKAVEP